jgi:hypothetical protein
MTPWYHKKSSDGHWRADKMTIVRVWQTCINLNLCNLILCAVFLGIIPMRTPGFGSSVVTSIHQFHSPRHNVVYQRGVTCKILYLYNMSLFLQLTNKGLQYTNKFNRLCQPSRTTATLKKSVFVDWLASILQDQQKHNILKMFATTSATRMFIKKAGLHSAKSTATRAIGTQATASVASTIWIPSSASVLVRRRRWWRQRDTNSRSPQEKSQTFVTVTEVWFVCFLLTP